MNTKKYTIDELKHLAENGDADAQWRLGHAYKSGSGVQRNPTDAFKWTKLSADQGNSNGQWLLGTFFADGHGVERDYSEAVMWYRRSAEQGNSSGQYCLGICFDTGEGVEEDEEQAEKWLLLSATQGDQWAQWYLGCFYDFRGNEEKACNWFRLSAEQGNDQAKLYLDKIENKLIIDGAPGKEFIEKISINSDPNALRDFFYSRIKWASGYPLIHDKYTYSAFDDLRQQITYKTILKLLPKALNIALNCKDREFHMALGLLIVLMPIIHTKKIIRGKNFSDQLLRLRLRVEKLSFLSNLESTWNELVRLQKNLHAEDDYLNYFTVEQLGISPGRWKLYFPYPLVNYGDKFIDELKISPEKLCDLAFQDVNVASQMEFVFCTRIEKATYWVWRVQNQDGSSLIADMVYLRQSDTEEPRWGSWSLYQQFQERDDPKSISDRLMNIEYTVGGENTINL